MAPTLVAPRSRAAAAPRAATRLLPLLLPLLLGALGPRLAQARLGEPSNATEVEAAEAPEVPRNASEISAPAMPGNSSADSPDVDAESRSTDTADAIGKAFGHVIGQLINQTLDNMLGNRQGNSSGYHLDVDGDFEKPEGHSYASLWFLALVVFLAVSSCFVCIMCCRCPVSRRMLDATGAVAKTQSQAAFAQSRSERSASVQSRSERSASVTATPSA